MKDLISQIKREAEAALAAQAERNVAADMPVDPLSKQEELVNRLITEAMDTHSAESLARGRKPLSLSDEGLVRQAVLDKQFGLAGFEKHLRNPEVEDIYCQGCDQVFVLYRDGRMERVGPVAASDEELIELIRSFGARLGYGERRFDLAQPILNMRLPNGDRMLAVMGISKRPSVTIRRMLRRDNTLWELQREGTLDDGLRRFLTAVVLAKKNVIISGAPGVGKTTLLSALAAEIPPSERPLTIEDTYELGLDEDTDAHPNCLALQTREPNAEGRGGIGLIDLVYTGLRASPTRTIVGELRGGEILAMLNSMTQGSDGSLSTVHCSSSRMVFARLISFAMQAKENMSAEAAAMLIGNALHFVVHMSFTRDRTRVISSVREVIGAQGDQVISNEVYRPDIERRAVRTGTISAETLDDLELFGSLDVQRWLAS